MPTCLTTHHVTLEECKALRIAVYGDRPDPAACAQYDDILRELRLLAMGAGLGRHTAETRPIDVLFRYVAQALAAETGQVESNDNVTFA